MSHCTNKQLRTVAMEYLQDQSPLFLIHSNTNDMILGDHKHGSLDVGWSANKTTIERGVEAELFEISCLEVDEDFEIWPDAMSFYGCHGEFGGNEVARIRPFHFPRRNGFIRLHDLFGPHTTLKFNPSFRRWARFKLSKLYTVAHTLNDIVIIKLLDHNYLSFHSSCAEIDGKAFLFAGLPNTGKTYLTMQLLSDGANFMSEDITLVNKKMVATGLPFTATMEKRRKVNLIQQTKANLYQFLYKQNFAKETFFDTDFYTGKNICSKAPIAGLFFLKKGEDSGCLAGTKTVLKDLINLQHLEFSYSRNQLILAYLFFNRQTTIDEYLAKEAEIMGQMIESVPAYEISAPDHTGFYPLVKQIINELSK